MTDKKRPSGKPPENKKKSTRTVGRPPVEIGGVSSSFGRRHISKIEITSDRPVPKPKPKPKTGGGE